MGNICLHLRGPMGMTHHLGYKGSHACIEEAVDQVS